jgi:D-alanyl-D-alanine carboxypeptidase
LLIGDSSWKDKIYGGKTGYTLQANGCLVLVIKDNNKYLINIILGADDRFGQMQNLIDNEL